MKGAFGFVEDEGVGAAHDDGDGRVRDFGRDAGYFYDAGSRGLGLFYQLGGAEFVFGEGVDVSYWFAACRLKVGRC